MAETGTGKRAVVALTAALLAGSAALWVTSESDLPQSDGRAALAASRSTVAPVAPPTPDTSRASVSQQIPARTADLEVAAKNRRTGGWVPTRLSIARLDISMRIVPVGVDDSDAMSIPEDPKVAGWYRFGPRPADTAGATVISGHLDTAAAGVGPLSRVKTARKGDRIMVAGFSLSRAYKVESVSRIPKTQLNLGKVFDRDAGPRLHLLTCGGDFDPTTGHYEDNILIVALAGN